MLVGKAPFSTKNPEALHQFIMQGNYNIPKSIKLSMEAAHFLNSCLCYEVADRLSFDDLIAHPYLQSEAYQVDQSLSLSFQSSNSSSVSAYRKPSTVLSTKNPEVFKELYMRKRREYLKSLSS